MKTTIKLTLASIAIFANVASAASIRYDGGVFDGGPTANNYWSTAGNWLFDNVPGVNDDAHINITGSGIAVLNSDAGTIKNLRVGVDESGILTATTGGVLTTSAGDFSGLAIGGGNNMGTLNLSGATLTFNEAFFVALFDGSTGILNITSGSMRVNDLFVHNLYNTTASSTTVLSGGLLDVNSMILNSGVFDITGGTLVLRNGNQTSQVAAWATSGRMTAYGQNTGLSAVYDGGNNWTTISAVPEPSAAVPVLGCLAGFALLRRRRA